MERRDGGARGGRRRRHTFGDSRSFGSCGCAAAVWQPRPRPLPRRCALRHRCASATTSAAASAQAGLRRRLASRWRWPGETEARSDAGCRRGGSTASNSARTEAGCSKRAAGARQGRQVLEGVFGSQSRRFRFVPQPAAQSVLPGLGRYVGMEAAVGPVHTRPAPARPAARRRRADRLEARPAVALSRLSLSRALASAQEQDCFKLRPTASTALLKRRTRAGHSRRGARHLGFSEARSRRGPCPIRVGGGGVGGSRQPA